MMGLLELWRGPDALAKQAEQAQLTYAATRSAEAQRYARIEMRYVTLKMTVEGAVKTVAYAQAQLERCPAAAEVVDEILEAGFAGIKMELAGLSMDPLITRRY